VVGVAVPQQEVPALGPHERRAFARIPAADLEWIREVRLKYGSPVSLVDLSPRGALLQTSTQLRPGTVQVLEIVGPQIESVPFRVVRCHLTQIGEAGAIYRGACEFKRTLELITSRSRGRAPLLRIDLALRQMLGRQRERVRTAGGRPLRLRDGRALQTELRTIGASAVVNDPLGRGVCDILSDLVPALDRGEPAAALRTRLEGLVRRAIPGLDIAVASAPLPAARGRESIYFATGDGGGSPQGVINVLLPAGAALADWQFRLLQAGSYLLELVASAGSAGEGTRSEPAAGAVIPVETGCAWQRIVVRYREGHLLKGYTHDFHPARPQFSLWRSMDAPAQERVLIPLTHLKAVFFVRDFDGDPGYVDRQVFEGAHNGRRLEVMFADGEVLIGSTLNYHSDGIGFFLTPADRQVNNERVFVVASALRHVRFL
jgi:hypothetical protein